MRLLSQLTNGSIVESVRRNGKQAGPASASLTVQFELSGFIRRRAQTGICSFRTPANDQMTGRSGGNTRKHSSFSGLGARKLRGVSKQVNTSLSMMQNTPEDLPTSGGRGSTRAILSSRIAHRAKDTLTKPVQTEVRPTFAARLEPRPLGTPRRPISAFGRVRLLPNRLLRLNNPRRP